MTNDFKDSPDGIIYFLYSWERDLIKIGTSRVDQLVSRLSRHRKRWGEITELGFRFGSYELERELHNHFDEYRYRGRKHGAPSEWFYDNPELREYIRNETAAPDTIWPLIKKASHYKSSVDIELTKLMERRLPFVPRNNAEARALGEAMRPFIKSWLQAHPDIPRGNMTFDQVSSSIEE